MSLIRLEKISRRYQMGSETIHALREVSLEIQRGEYVAIMGPSGSGKSTLMNLIGCLDTPTAGEYVLNGVQVSQMDDNQLAEIRNKEIGFIFQTFNLLPVLSAEENVEYPLLQMPEVSKEERRARVNDYLKLVGLAKYAHHRPNQLSGGQRQRVAIARALVTHSKVVLADEPTANLDKNTGKSILDLMQRINEDCKTTFVFSTHDKQVMSRAVHQVRMEDGQPTKLGLKLNGTWRFVPYRA